MKLSFSHRMIGGLVGVALFLSLAGYLAFKTIWSLQDISQTVMKENITSLKAAEELELALLNQKGLVASYFLDGNPVWLRTLEEKKQDFHIWFGHAWEVALTAEEKKILNDIGALYTIYDTQRNRAIRLYQEGNLAEAKYVLLNEVRKSIEALYQRCEDLIYTNEVLIGEAESESKRYVSEMTRLIWAAVISTLCLGVLMGFFVTRETSRQLVRSAKLASLGQLSATVAHEVRNPLTSIKMRLYSLQGSLRGREDAVEDASVIGEEIERLEKIVQHFLDFARPPEPNPQKTDLHRILESTVDLISPKASAQRVDIMKKWRAPGAEIELDREQMRQAFLNIELNAIEAMPEGGKLEITTSFNGDKGAGRFLQVTFQDTGKGIAPHLSKRLFEPFVTDKQTGTGLGLFIASRVIQKHKGVITLNSEVGKGTTVTVKLPLTFMGTPRVVSRRHHG